MLNSTTRTQCFNLTLLSDSLIEGDEMLGLFLSEPLDSFGIRLIQPNTTNITIIDVDCELNLLSVLVLATKRVVLDIFMLLT